MKPIQTASILLISGSLVACSNDGSVLPKLDYQSENNKVISLEVPPDLSNPNQGNLYELPSGTTAAPNAMQTKSKSVVLTQLKKVHIERSGTQRWLVVEDKSAEEIWSVLRTFWQESGFTIASEEPRAGLMETDWAENRAKLPNQGLRRIFDKVGIGGIYTTSERDKFLIRIERNAKGGVDIFFTHKGLEEVYADKWEDTIVWQPRANDPNLEAAFLARFMQYVGVDEEVINKELDEKEAAVKSSELAKREANSVLVYGDAARNVNRIGAALDRIGLTVQEFVPERGIFVVRPAPSTDEAVQEAKAKTAWFNRLLGKNKQEEAGNTESQTQLFVALEALEQGQRVHLLNQFGQTYVGNDANRWLNELHRELR